MAAEVQRSTFSPIAPQIHPLDSAFQRLEKAGLNIASERIEDIKRMSNQLVYELSIEMEFFSAVERSLLMILIANRAVETQAGFNPDDPDFLTAARQRQEAFDRMSHIVNLAISVFGKHSSPIENILSDEDIQEGEVDAAYEAITNAEFSDRIEILLNETDIVDPVRARFGFEEDKPFRVRVLNICTYTESQFEDRDSQVAGFTNEELRENLDVFSESLTGGYSNAWVTRIKGEITLCIPLKYAHTILNPPTEASDAETVQQYSKAVSTLKHEFFHTQSDIQRSLYGVMLGIGVEELGAELDLGNTNAYLDVKKHFLGVRAVGGGSVIDPLRQFNHKNPYSSAAIIINLIAQCGMDACLDLLSAVPGSYSDSPALAELVKDTHGLEGLEHKLWDHIVDNGQVDVAMEGLKIFGDNIAAAMDPSGYANVGPGGNLPFVIMMLETQQHRTLKY